jgi:glutathione S-transferase
MPQRLRVIGNYISPYVRKVLACLELKGLDYEIDPIAPFVGNEEFARISPLRRIPVLLDGDLVLTDSSVICQYLEDRHPTPSVYPRDIADRAKARWLGEYADTRLADGLIWRLFHQLAIKRHVFGEAPNEAVVQHAREVEIPAALDYVERQLPEDGFAFGALSIADIAIACFFRNAAFARFSVDATRWPKTAAFVERTLAHPAFAALLPFEDVQRSVEIKGRRQALLDAGAPLTEETFAVREPRQGIMRL